MICKLPININSNHTSECWTFYKCCILDTYLEGKKWEAINMEIYLDGNDNAFWGDGNSFYPLEHYDTILKIVPASLRRISEKRIISFLEKSIKSGLYVIMDCNISKISFSSNDLFRIHEILIYGYDDEARVFFSPLLDNNTGNYTIVEIPYEKIISAYSDVRKRYIQDPEYRYSRRYYYFYPLTKIKPQMVKLNKYEFLFSIIRRINNETRNEKKTIEKMDENGTIIQTRHIFKGLGCATRIRNVLENYLNSTDEQKTNIDITHTLLKIYEHKDNLLLGISVALNEINNDQELQEQMNAYASIVRQFKKAYLLSYKYSNTKNINDLKRLHSIIAKNLILEPQILKSISDGIARKIKECYRSD